MNFFNEYSSLHILYLLIILTIIVRHDRLYCTTDHYYHQVHHRDLFVCLVHATGTVVPYVIFETRLSRFGANGIALPFELVIGIPPESAPLADSVKEMFQPDKAADVPKIDLDRYDPSCLL